MHSSDRRNQKAKTADESHIKSELNRGIYIYIYIYLGRVQHNTTYEGWNFNSGNYLFTTDTK